jgi:hypothetical protein
MCQGQDEEEDSQCDGCYEVGDVLPEVIAFVCFERRHVGLENYPLWDFWFNSLKLYWYIQKTNQEPQVDNVTGKMVMKWPQWETQKEFADSYK